MVRFLGADRNDAGACRGDAGQRGLIGLELQIAKRAPATAIKGDDNGPLCQQGSYPNVWPSASGRVISGAWFSNLLAHFHRRRPRTDGRCGVPSRPDDRPARAASSRRDTRRAVGTGWLTSLVSPWSPPYGSGMLTIGLTDDCLQPIGCFYVISRRQEILQHPLPLHPATAEAVAGKNLLYRRVRLMIASAKPLP